MRKKLTLRIATGLLAAGTVLGAGAALAGPASASPKLVNGTPYGGCLTGVHIDGTNLCYIVG